MARPLLRRVGQVLTGLTALVALLAMLVGAPIGLAVLGGNPLPDHLPGLAEITDTLLGRDESGTLFVATITLVGWGAWIAFAVPILIESLARLRGVRTPRIPGLSAPQAIAAGLVGAVALLIASPALAGGAPAYAGPAVAISAPAVAGAPTVAGVQGQPAITTVTLPIQAAPGTTAPTIKYKVSKNDDLFDISGRMLGDPERYPELGAVNHIANLDHIEPNQELVLPADAVDAGPRRHATGSVITVSAPPAQTPPAADPSGAGAQPQPGTGTAPPTATATPNATTGPTQPAASGPAQAATPAAADPTGTSTTASAPDGGSNTVLVAATVGGIGMLAMLTLVALRHRRARQQQHRRQGRRIPQPASGKAEATLRAAAADTNADRLDAALRVLAAGLADWPDEQWPDVVAAWLDNGAIHLVLTEPCAHPAPPPWLDDGATIWTLPAHLALPDVEDHLAPLPTLCAIGSQDGQQLLVDLERLGMLTLTGDPTKALELLRYIAGELAHNRWSDDVQVILAGFDPDEARLLVELNPERVSAAASVEAALTRFTRQLTDTRTALAHAGAATTVHGRVTDTGEAWTPQVLLVTQPGPQDVARLGELERELVDAPSCGYAVVATAAADTTDAGYGRWPATVSTDGQLHVTFLADTPLTASSLPATLLEPLAELLRTARLPGDAPTPPAPDTEEWARGTDAAGGLRDLLDVDEAEGEEEQPEDPSPAPIRLTTSEARPSSARRDPLTEPVLLTLRPGAAAADAQAAAERRKAREARDPQLDTDAAAWFDVEPSRPRIGVLGQVQIEAPGTPPPNRLRFHGEIIVYLAARGARGATAAQLEDAIWRDREASSSNRRSLISRARRWLGDKPDGSKWMPAMSGGAQLYRIDDGFLLDWALFRRLRARGEARGTDGAGDLRRALELVRGVPFATDLDAYTAERAPYAWLSDSEIAPTHLVAAIVDTAHELVELCLADDDVAGARWALERAWLADPERHEDQPWRDAMRIAHADGRDSELKALIQNLLTQRDVDVPEELDPETYRLVQRLMPYLRSAAS
jgi:hypothetical protein